MPVWRRIAASIVVVAVGAPAAAAQTTTIPRGGADVSTTPPVPLAPATSKPDEKLHERVVASSELPNTGSDPRMLFLCGVALTLVGVGLRLRTADADLY